MKTRGTKPDHRLKLPDIQTEIETIPGTVIILLRTRGETVTNVAVVNVITGNGGEAANETESLLAVTGNGLWSMMMNAGTKIMTLATAESTQINAQGRTIIDPMIHHPHSRVSYTTTWIFTLNSTHCILLQLPGPPVPIKPLAR